MSVGSLSYTEDIVLWNIRGPLALAILQPTFSDVR